ncbi:MAG: hypothetical protein ABIT16_02665 [Croceibacterium sp.]
MCAAGKPERDERDERQLAHELANLVQVVSGNLELLDARVTDEQLRRYITNARSAAEQLAALSHSVSTAPRDS